MALDESVDFLRICEMETFFIPNERDPDNPDTREPAVMCAGIALS